jgi:hypothetical protein
MARGISVAIAIGGLFDSKSRGGPLNLSSIWKKLEFQTGNIAKRYIREYLEVSTIVRLSFVSLLLENQSSLR